SHRSSVRTFAPNVRRSVADPSSASRAGPWPITTTNAGTPPNYHARRMGELDLRSADRDRADLDRGAPDADGNALPVFPACPDPIGCLDVVAEHLHFTKNVGAVADQVHPFEGGGDLAVLDEVALGEREHEVAIRDVDLPSTELLREDPPLYALE